MSATLTVEALCAAVTDATTTAFPDEVWVSGAISGLSRAPNGHVYFDLVDPAGPAGESRRHLVPVVLFATNRERVNLIIRKSGGARMGDGMEIRIRGRVRYYPPQARIQLDMSLIDPVYTIGRITEARDELLKRLAAEGVLGRNAARPLADLPLRVALVTSEGSAAHHDVAHELATSGFRFVVDVHDTRVQGADAVPGLVAAITAAGRTGADVVVVARGGGAKGDLLAFDHEDVARAIVACPVPVVVGVGHETDRSVADEVAHTSAKTPTATAGVLIGAARAFEQRVDRASARLTHRVIELIDRASLTLRTDARRLIQATERAVERGGARLDADTRLLTDRAGRLLDRGDDRVDRATLVVRSLDPRRQLDRGWAVATTADGTLLRSVHEIQPGETLITRLASGTIHSTIDAIVPTDTGPDPVPGEPGPPDHPSGAWARHTGSQP